MQEIGLNHDKSENAFFIVWIDYNDSISDKTTTNNITHLVDDLHLFYIKTKFYSIVCHLELELFSHVLS